MLKANNIAKKQHFELDILGVKWLFKNKEKIKKSSIIIVTDEVFNFFFFNSF